MNKSRVFIIILSILLSISVSLNTILFFTLYNSSKGLSNDFNKSATTVGNNNFDLALVGTWCYKDDEIIISEDGSYIWTDYSSGDDAYIFSCSKGFISDYIMIQTSKYSCLKNTNGLIETKDTFYYNHEDIPESEWDSSGKKSGGYQIIFHGSSFGLQTDANITNYNFIKQ